jgi:hypothetical protein
VFKTVVELNICVGSGELGMCLEIWIGDSTGVMDGTRTEYAISLEIVAFC